MNNVKNKRVSGLHGVRASSVRAGTVPLATLNKLLQKDRNVIVHGAV